MDKKSLQKKNKYMTIKTLLQRRTSYAPYSGKIPFGGIRVKVVTHL